jgi:hypothetical protein
MPKSHEDVLFERFQRAGLELRVDQRDARFTFVVSPTTTPGVDRLEISELAATFQRGVFTRVAEQRLSSSLAGIVIFPRILDPDVCRWADGGTYKRKDRSYFVKRAIPFEAWKAASSNGRADLFAANLSNAVNSVPERHLPTADKQKLVEAIDEVRRALAMTAG